MKSQNYRPEIEGLRAVAVLAVVFFHVGPDWLKGGFVGVDVFFVISGYLITSIIVRQSEAGTFSFKDFWWRRVRRLFPALAVVLVCTVIVGYFTLIGDEWVSLGSQVTSVLLFMGNFQMWQLANDYWGQAAQDTPLLHTWSLAVEEQFYLLYPLALIMLLKAGRRFVLPALLFALALSFAVSLYGTNRMPAATFYLLPSRAWELLIGCALAVWMQRKQVAAGNRMASSWFALVGLIVTTASCIWIDGSSGFPGFKAVLPTVGAALILAFAGSSSRYCLTTRLLSHPISTYIGRISYSLYLWHWPVIVFSHWYGVSAVWVIVSSFLLAIASYHLVETPLRRNIKLQWALPVTALLMLGAVLPVRYGFVSSSGLPDALAFVDAPVATTRGQEFEAKFLLGEGGVQLNCDGGATPELVLLGSSHARVLSRPFADYANEKGKPLALLGCTHLGVSDNESPEALVRMDWVEQWKPATLVLAGRWDQEAESERFEEDLGKVLVKMASWSDQCIVLGQVPMIKTDQNSGKNLRKFIITEYRRTGGLPNFELDDSCRVANEKVRSIVEALDLPNLRFVETEGTLMHDGAVQAIQNSTLLYADQDHLNDAGAAIIFERTILPLITE